MFGCLCGVGVACVDVRMCLWSWGWGHVWMSGCLSKVGKAHKCPDTFVELVLSFNICELRLSGLPGKRSSAVNYLDNLFCVLCVEKHWDWCVHVLLLRSATAI